jgi:hypothetical protein
LHIKNVKMTHLKKWVISDYYLIPASASAFTA